jgi:hypothetical protein
LALKASKAREVLTGLQVQRGRKASVVCRVNKDCKGFKACKESREIPVFKVFRVCRDFKASKAIRAHSRRLATLATAIVSSPGSLVLWWK